MFLGRHEKTENNKRKIETKMINFNLRRVKMETKRKRNENDTKPFVARKQNVYMYEMASTQSTTLLCAWMIMSFLCNDSRIDTHACFRVILFDKSGPMIWAPYFHQFTFFYGAGTTNFIK